MQRIRSYAAVFLLLLFSCYYSSISMFSHAHIVNGTSVQHSHLGGGASHDHSDSQYGLIEILSNFQAESASVFYQAVSHLYLSESDICTEYLAPSHLSEVNSVHSLRGPPQYV